MSIIVYNFTFKHIHMERMILVVINLDTSEKFVYDPKYYPKNQSSGYFSGLFLNMCKILKLTSMPQTIESIDGGPSNSALQTESGQLICKLAKSYCCDCETNQFEGKRQRQMIAIEMLKQNLIC